MHKGEMTFLVRRLPHKRTSLLSKVRNQIVITFLWENFCKCTSSVASARMPWMPRQPNSRAIFASHYASSILANHVNLFIHPSETLLLDLPAFYRFDHRSSPTYTLASMLYIWECSGELQTVTIMFVRSLVHNKRWRSLNLIQPMREWPVLWCWF